MLGYCISNVSDRSRTFSKFCGREGSPLIDGARDDREAPEMRAFARSAFNASCRDAERDTLQVRERTARQQRSRPIRRFRNATDQEGSNSLNIKQVKYFLSVAECKSLSAAAREEGVSVQAMSKAMKDFEKELSAPLLVRSSGGVALTPFGEEFYRKARCAWEAFHELETATPAGLYENRPVQIALCAPMFLQSKRTQAALESYFSKIFGIETQVSIGEGESALGELHVGTYDAVITIGRLDRPGYDCVPLGTVPPGVCIAKNHPLAKRESVALEDLSSFAALSSPRFDHFNESILVTYQKHGLGMNVVEPDPNNPLHFLDLFYRKHAVCFMVEIPALGEMVPGSVLVPIAKEEARAIPICLISEQQAKSHAYRLVEAALNANDPRAL